MFGVRVHEQLLESLRQKSLLPRLRNDRVIRLLGRLFRLVFRGFCYNTGGEGMHVREMMATGIEVVDRNDNL
jgi:hypothetical protein